jgi:hypothetical protein
MMNVFEVILEINVSGHNKWQLKKWICTFQPDSLRLNDRLNGNNTGDCSFDTAGCTYCNVFISIPESFLSIQFEISVARKSDSTVLDKRIHFIRAMPSAITSRTYRSAHVR